MVLKQCQILVNLSPDIATWNNSKYGAFLRFSSTQSLSMTRKHWSLYIGTTDFSKAEMDSLRAEFRKGIYANDPNDSTFGLNLTTYRSAGPLWMELKDLEIGRAHV